MTAWRWPFCLPHGNHLFPMYVSYRPDSDAFAIDAFSLQWSCLNVFAFPPFSVFLTVLISRKKPRSRSAARLASLGFVPQSYADIEIVANLPQGKEGSTTTTQSSKGNAPNLAQIEPSRESRELQFVIKREGCNYGFLVRRDFKAIPHIFKEMEAVLWWQKILICLILRGQQWYWVPCFFIQGWIRVQCGKYRSLSSFLSSRSGE